MIMIRPLVCSALVGLLPLNTYAQRLLWETAIVRPSPAGGNGLSCVVPQGTQLLVNGEYFPARSTGCRPTIQAYARVYTMAGALVREQLGRGLQNGESNIVAAPGGGAWWAGRGYQCPAGAAAALQHPYLQRLTAAGDTLRGWWLAPAAPRATTTATLLQGNRLLTAGMVSPVGTPAQGQQFSLTCSDTLGRVRWTRAYPRPPAALDFSIGIAPTPRGGYLLSGDAYVGTGYRHYLVETDSGGQLRRQVLLLPLGPAVTNGSRAYHKCNVLPLPNAQGYLLSGTADSLEAGQFPPGRQLGYVMRLDTALNIQWVYRHPPALAGNGARSNEGWRIRFLPNNSVGLLLTEVRGAGTPAAYLAQVDIATGRRLGFYELLSNSQATVMPNDWQWVGDGTLVLCGKSTQVGGSGSQGYLARWDFRNTPLLAARAGGATRPATVRAYPNPAHETVTIDAADLTLPAARCQLVATVTGQVVLVQDLHGGRATLAVAGLAPGVYLGRLLSITGQTVGTCKIVVIH